jgi:Flp pilus assembly protein TadD
MEAYAEAEKVLRAAVEIEPGYARAWDNLAAALGAQAKLAEAMDACREAVKLRPDYPEAHFKMGLIHFARKEWDAAEQELEKGKASSASKGDCEVLLALAYGRLDKGEEANAAVERAAEAQPRSELLWMAWNDLGLARLTENDSEGAARAFQAALECAPDETGAWINLGICRHRSGEKEAARAAFQRAVELDPSAGEGWHNLGTVCVELNDLPAAVSAFRQETVCAPDNVRAWHDLGVALKKMDQMDAARDAFARAESLEPAAQKAAADEPSRA